MLILIGYFRRLETNKKLLRKICIKRAIALSCSIHETLMKKIYSRYNYFMINLT